MDRTGNLVHTDVNGRVHDSLERAFNVLEKLNHISERHLGLEVIVNSKGGSLV